MYTHHQPKHLNTERWRQHWSSCYNQISCWKLLSPGIYINACLMSIIHPNIIADQMNPLMATVLLDGRTIHVQHLRNSSGNGLMNLNWPLNSSDPKSVEHQISWASVGCARAKSHPCRGPPWIVLGSRYIQWTLSWIEIWGIQSPGWHFELSVTFLWSLLSSFCSDAAALSCWEATAMEEWVVLLKEASRWRLRLKVSQQNVALSQDDQCYLFHLLLVLILWRLVGCTHVKKHTNKHKTTTNTQILDK